MVCVPAVLYIWESTFWGDMTNQRYRDHFPAELGHRKTPEIQKSRFARTYVHVHTWNICDQKSALLWWLTSCCEKGWKNDVVFKKVLSWRANNKRLPALHLKCAWTKVLPMARRNCTWTTTLHSSTEPRLPRPITGGNVRTCKVDAPTIEEEMLPSPSYRPRCATIYTSR